MKFKYNLLKCFGVLVTVATLFVSCTEINATVTLPETLYVSGAGIENGGSPQAMVEVKEGIWDIYANFYIGKSVSVKDQSGKLWASFEVSPVDKGVCRLRVNAAEQSWSLVKINKVSLVVAEGWIASSKFGTTPPIEAQYQGGGVWIVSGLFISTDRLRYRFELQTSNSDELKYWCAIWDNSGLSPSAHSPEYLKIRALGQDEYDALFLKDNRACWMFPKDKTMKLADFTISMNAAVPGQQIKCKSPHTGPAAAFIGDSITWLWKQGAYSRPKSNIIIPIDPMPSYMTESGDNVLLRYNPEFFTANNYINVGISGQKTTDMLARFKVDILDKDPSCVVIMGGTNDLAYGYSKETILSNIAAMAESAEELGMSVILCSVTPCNATSSYLSNPPTKGEHIIALNKMIKDYALGKGFTYCDYWTSTVAEDGLDLDPAYWLYDHLHPCPVCYTSVMEKIIKPLIDECL